MVVSDERVEIHESELVGPDAVARLHRGHGQRRRGLDPGHRLREARRRSRPASHARSPRSSTGCNTRCWQSERPYLLIGFGRWGSSDPWLGIPVRWGQICGARVIVEATLPEMDVEPSQGAHFFHNISSFGVSYLTVHHRETAGIDWAWLDRQPAVAETEYIRHVRLDEPLLVKVDGRNRRGGIWRQR